MARHEIGCELWLDGTRVPDNPASALAGIPTALADLSVTFGRDRADTQPDPATASFGVLDDAANGELATRVKAGAGVEIRAVLPVDYPAGQQWFDDPSMSSWGVDMAAPVTAPNKAGHLAPTRAGTAQVVPSPANGAAFVSGFSTYRVSPFAGAGPSLYLLPRPVGSSEWQALPSLAGMGPVTITISLYSPNPDMDWQLWPATYNPQTGAVFAAGVPPQSQRGSKKNYSVTQTVNWTAGDKPAVYISVGDSAGTQIVSWSQVAGSWDSQGVRRWRDFTGVYGLEYYVDDVRLTTAVPLTANSEALVFRGRITDVDITPDPDGVLATATAVDAQAEWAHRYIGDDPWLAEGVRARVNRITGLAQMPAVAVPDADAATKLSWRDVDSRSPVELLQEIADSIGSNLWLRSWYYYDDLWLEDPMARTPYDTLTVINGIVVIQPNPNTTNALHLSACDVLADPTVFRQDTDTVISITDVAWLEQTVNEDGLPEPTERHEIQTDPAAITKFGTRRLGISTQLAEQPPAVALATETLARLREVSWTVPNAVWDTDIAPGNQANALRLLNAVSRIATPVVIEEMPAWSPVGQDLVCWLEGASFEYAGAWTFNLNLSPGGDVGKSATWQNLKDSPSIANQAWNSFAPEIDWRDLISVGAPAS